jgi:predicted transcriptional regulator
MKAQLTTEQSDALNQSDDTLSLVDPRTHRVYVLVDQIVHQQAMDALQRQRDEDAAAIQQGLDDMHAGRGMSLDESRTRTLDALVRLSQ